MRNLFRVVLLGMLGMIPVAARADVPNLGGPAPGKVAIVVSSANPCRGGPVMAQVYLPTALMLGDVVLVDLRGRVSTLHEIDALLNAGGPGWQLSIDAPSGVYFVAVTAHAEPKTVPGREVHGKILAATRLAVVR